MGCVRVYARVSSSKQEEAGTIQSQVEYVRNRCADLLGDEPIYYLDEAQSAYKKALWQRPAGKRLLEDAQPEDVVVVFKLNRLGRRLHQTEQAIEMLMEKGARIYTASDQRWIDEVTPTGIVTRQILGAVAELERNETVEATRSGLERLARSGELMPSKTVLGYRWSETTNGRKRQGAQLEIDPDEAKLVQVIFDLYERKTPRQTALWVNAQGCVLPRKSPKNQQKFKSTHRPFQAIDITRIVTNELYVGYVTWGRTTRVPWEKPEEIRRHHPELQIISFEQFNRVQRLRATRQGVPPKSQGSPYVFSGLVRCPHCGGRTVGSRSSYRGRSGNVIKPKRYKCRAYAQLGRDACRGWEAREVVVKAALIPFLADLLENRLKLRDVLSQEARAMELEGREGQSRRLQEDKARAERDIRKAQEGYREDIYTAEEARRLVMEGRERIEKASRQLAKLNEVGTLRQELRAALQAMDQSFDEVLRRLPDEYLSLICRMVFKSFTVWKKGFGRGVRAGIESWDFTPEIQSALTDRISTTLHTNASSSDSRK